MPASTHATDSLQNKKKQVNYQTQTSVVTGFLKQRLFKDTIR